MDIDIHYSPWSILYPHFCTVVYSDANMQVILLLYIVMLTDNTVVVYSDANR